MEHYSKCSTDILGLLTHVFLRLSSSSLTAFLSYLNQVDLPPFSHPTIFSERDEAHHKIWKCIFYFFPQKY